MRWGTWGRGVISASVTGCVQVWVEVRAVGGVSGEFSVAPGSCFVCQSEAAALSEAGVSGQRGAMSGPCAVSVCEPVGYLPRV